MPGSSWDIGRIGLCCRLNSDIIAYEISQWKRSQLLLTKNLLALAENPNFAYKPKMIAEDLCKLGNHSGYGAMMMAALSGQEMWLFVPSDIFSPEDPWSVHFRQALASQDLTGQAVVELGSGSGVTAVEMLLSPTPPAKLVLVEIDEHALKVSRLNILLNCREMIARRGIEIEFLLGDAVNVLADLTVAGYRFDVICGCLPQVPIQDVRELAKGQNVAHYYDPVKYPDLYHWGLGLLEAVQQQAKVALKPGGRFATIYSGRVPQEIRDELHRLLKAESTVLSKTMVPHCPTTSLVYLFGQANSHQLLFLDPEGRKSVRPEEAEQLRLAALEKDPATTNCGIYHHILIVENRF